MSQQCKMKFCSFNYAEAGSDITVSSEDATFTAANASDPVRSRVWTPTGYFQITDDNNKYYGLFGIPFTATVPTGEYTGATLAAALEVALNAASSGFSVTYNNIAGTYKFEITNASLTTIVLTTTTDAIFDTLGFTGTADRIDTVHTADEQRNHSFEFYQVDNGTPLEVTAMHVICPIDEIFSLSNNAEIRLQGNNVDVWDSPPLDVAIDYNERGVYKFFDTTAIDTEYRYHRIKFIDRMNPAGPESLRVSFVYIGDTYDIESSNVAKGFTRQQEDQSITMTSEAGQKYFDTRSKFETFSSLSIQNIEADDRNKIEQIFNDNGIHTPFFMSIDPFQVIEDDPSLYTKYVYFGQKPSFKHLFLSYYIVNFNLIEVV